MAGGVTSVINHHLLGYWYDTDPVQIALLTPSLAFTDIPEGIGGTGVTTYRAIKFEVQSCGNVRLDSRPAPSMVPMSSICRQTPWHVPNPP
jgi:hypothetical protein